MMEIGSIGQIGWVAIPRPISKWLTCLNAKRDGAPTARGTLQQEINWNKITDYHANRVEIGVLRTGNCSIVTVMTARRPRTAVTSGHPTDNKG
jgi:hypothetical protein